MAPASKGRKAPSSWRASYWPDRNSSASTARSSTASPSPVDLAVRRVRQRGRVGGGLQPAVGRRKRAHAGWQLWIQHQVRLAHRPFRCLVAVELRVRSMVRTRKPLAEKSSIKAAEVAILARRVRCSIKRTSAGGKAVHGAPPIGRLYDVEGRHLLLHHSGTGGPAVVLCPGPADRPRLSEHP